MGSRNGTVRSLGTSKPELEERYRERAETVRTMPSSAGLEPFAAMVFQFLETLGLDINWSMRYPRPSSTEVRRSGSRLMAPGTRLIVTVECSKKRVMRID